MAKLPFIVEPRLKPVIEEIGSEDSGKIQVERRGYLTSGEKAFFQQVKQSDQGTAKLIAMSRKVSQSASLDMSKAYELVIRVLSGGADSDLDREIEEKFAEDFASVIQDLANSQSSDEMLMAACLLRYRVDSEIGMDEIMKMHPDIIQGLADLYRDEENRVLERLTEKEIKEERNIEKVAKKSSPKAVPTT
jgi:hypothetical protein